jgi:hypothetical protein
VASEAAKTTNALRAGGAGLRGCDLEHKQHRHVNQVEPHGHDRKDLHQGEENGPPHSKGNENTDDSVSNEASGSASLVKEGREETRQDIENGHTENMD